MGSFDKRHPAEWYEAAADSYVQQHQGCARCGGQHCVLRAEWGLRTEFHCSKCDFSACHDRDSGRYFAVPGDNLGVIGVALGLSDEETTESRETSDTPFPLRPNLSMRP
jgi:hypothetical protein